MLSSHFRFDFDAPQLGKQLIVYLFLISFSVNTILVQAILWMRKACKNERRDLSCEQYNRPITAQRRHCLLSFVFSLLIFTVTSEKNCWIILMSISHYLCCFIFVQWIIFSSTFFDEALASSEEMPLWANNQIKLLF